MSTILWEARPRQEAPPSVADLATLGKVCSVLPALEQLHVMWLCIDDAMNSAPNAGLEGFY